MANTIKTECSKEGCTREIRSYPGKGLCNPCYKLKNHHANKTPESMAKAAAEQRERSERIKAQQPDLYAAQVRRTNLWANYRITPEQYDTMLLQQDFKCAICFRHMSEFKKNFSVDHDHSCCPGAKSCGECVRGLLCANCNFAIGQFDDDIERMKSAISYIGGGSD